MGKICGLAYMDEKMNMVYLVQDNCDHPITAKWGPVKVSKGSSFYPYIQYNCEWFLGCTVDFQFKYTLDGVESWWRGVSVPSGISWINQGAAYTPSKSQEVLIVAYEGENFIDSVRMYVVEPQIYVERITPSKTTLTPGETIEVRVTVTNSGNIGGYGNIVLKDNGVEVDRKFVFVDDGESLDIVFLYTASSHGTHELCAEVS